MLTHRPGPTCFLMPTGAPGRRGWLVACQPWWELVCPVIAAIAAASGDSCVSAGGGWAGGLRRDAENLGPDGMQVGITHGRAPISSATLDAGWRGRIGLGAGLGVRQRLSRLWPRWVMSMPLAR